MEPYQPTLCHFPEETLGRFQVIRDFLRHWHRIDTGTVGRTVDRVDEAEGRIGKALPLAVREWIVLLDDLARLNGWERVLRDCWGLKKVPNCAAFALLTTGESDRHWGPMMRDLAKEDPPTHVFVPNDEVSAFEFKRGGQVASRVSTWAIEFILLYLYLSHSLQHERTLSKAAFERVRRHLPAGAVLTRIGKTRVIEFEGGLIRLEPQGPNGYRVQAYAPYFAESNNAYYRALGEFTPRVNALLNVGL